MAQPKKAAPDWERIEADYRAGLLSVREIASAHGISHTYINRKAKEGGWVRDLSKRIQDKAEALVSTATVSSGVSTETAIPDRVIVEANAQVIAQVRLSHRQDIARSRRLVMTLLEELEHQTEHRELYEKLGELMMQPDDNGRDKLFEAYMKAMALSGRTSTMKALSDALKTLVALEREAYSIADASKGPSDPGESAGSLGNDPIEAARAYQKIMQG